MFKPRSMRKALSFTGILLLWVACACTKADEILIERTKSLTVTNTDTLRLGLGFFEDDVKFSIYTQPSHSRLSSLERMNYPGYDIHFYHYNAEPGYVGNDYVELISNAGLDGLNHGNVKTIIRLNIKVDSN